MQEQHIHLNTLFAWMPPELLLDTILHGKNSFSGRELPLEVSSRGPSMDCYAHCARGHLPGCSEDELRQFYWRLRQHLSQDATGGVFSLLAGYGEEILLLHGTEPLCHQKDALSWRSVSHILGQDLFACALLAKRDVRENCRSTCFSWPSVIRTDNQALRSMLDQGISENHFHLNGSTQIFPLAWGFLMNHPDQTGRFFSKHFLENLKGNISQGPVDNTRPWKERIYYAAWIRAFLFEKLLGGKPEPTLSSFLRFCGSLDMRRELLNRTEELRFTQGAKLPMPGHRTKCLDYAVTDTVFQANPGPCRFLAGERSFLYQCFLCCFDGRFQQEEQDLLYLYLLLQIQLRGELIQSNQRVGFRNFSNYQDRKDNGWGMQAEYWEESYNLSINGTLATGVGSLEMRIMPRPSASALQKEIQHIDGSTAFYREQERSSHGFGRQPSGREGESPPYFYVLHFAKRPWLRISDSACEWPLQPRNADVRRKIYRQTQALARALEKYPDICGRIRGIDAASHEIGCRPETFATEFRFLRGFCPRRLSWQTVQEGHRWPRLGATFHAGEDFLDIADGLRAIDEAIRFLDLRPGDRLGHALALGIDPALHYERKSWQSVLPKQDLLDNVTWLLFRAPELGLDIPPGLHSLLKQQAEVLLREIYGACLRDTAPELAPVITLYDYYNSWMLRGDHPSLYEGGTAEAVQAAVSESRSPLLNELSPYPSFKLAPAYHSLRQLETLRKNPGMAALLYAYHYDPGVRLAGQETARFQISEAYIQLLRAVQDRMMTEIMEQGICVECNPTSNYLIGTFQRYDRHPIFRFNHFGLGAAGFPPPSTQLRVSVNTDDQGVFGTSLENEYALLMCCLQLRKAPDGQRLLSDDEIIAYLDHLRRMGNEMVFPEAPREPIPRAKL